MDVSIPLKLLRLHVLPLSAANTSTKTMPLQRQRSFPPTLFSFWQHPPIALNVFFSSPQSTTPTNQCCGKLLPLIRGQFSVPVTRSRDEAERSLGTHNGKEIEDHASCAKRKGEPLSQSADGHLACGRVRNVAWHRVPRQRKSSRAETDDFLETHPNTL